MKAIVVTDQAAGTAGMKLVDRPEPQASINDVVVQVYSSGFVNTELGWPSTWTDRVGRGSASANEHAESEDVRDNVSSAAIQVIDGGHCPVFVLCSTSANAP